jgi:hypothetical protein
MSRAERPSLPPVTFTVGTEQGVVSSNSNLWAARGLQATQKVSWRLALSPLTLDIHGVRRKEGVFSAIATVTAPKGSSLKKE